MKQNLSRRFEQALTCAVQLHARQPRKGTDIPYVSHLLAVTSLALEHGADEDEAIAALLHDAVEDQGGKPTHEAIRRQFGERVARIVGDCTDGALAETPRRAAQPSPRLCSPSRGEHTSRTFRVPQCRRARGSR